MIRFKSLALLGLLMYLGAAQPAVLGELSGRPAGADVRLEADLTFGRESGDENQMFSLIGDVDLDARGNVYVLDAMEFQVKIFDGQGNYLDRFTFKRGQGPGEVSAAPRLAVCPDGSLVILDPFTRRILVKEPGRESVRSFLVDFQAMDVDSTGIDGEVAFLGLDDGAIVHIFDLKGKRLRSFAEPFEVPGKLSANANMPALRTPMRLDCSASGKTFLLNPHKFEIRVYEGLQETGTVAGTNPLYKPLQMTRSNIGGPGIVRPVAFVFEHGDRLFVVIQGPGMDPKNQMEIFENGRSLGSIPVPGFPYAMDGEGRLYIYESSDFPKVVRYRIESGPR